MKFYKTMLYIAIEKGNLDVVKILLSRPEINPDFSSILKSTFF